MAQATGCRRIVLPMPTTIFSVVTAASFARVPAFLPPALLWRTGVSISVSATSAPGHSSLIPGCHITPAGKTGPHLPLTDFLSEL